MVTTEEQLAQFIIDTPAQSISGSLLKEVKRCVINLMAVCIYSARDPSLDILLNVFRVEGAKPKATVVGSGFRTSMQNTALANGYLAHLEDYDDTHFLHIGHPSVVVMSAALAVAEAEASSGEDFLAALTTGLFGFVLRGDFRFDAYAGHSLFGLLAIAVTLAPTSSLFALKETMAEHRAYLAFLGPCWVLALGIERLPRVQGGSIAVVVGAVLMAACRFPSQA